jgi:RimJ/RimL family protein N-acetyltransferase
MVRGVVTSAVLTTERLVLRQIGEADLDLHMTLLNTPAVMRHLGGVQPREVIAAKHEASRASFAAEGFGFMIMEERASGEFVGHCGLRRVAHPLAPNPEDHEIGWLVREDRWRLGYAHEAMRAVIDWGFGVHAVPHIIAITVRENIGSWRLMQKLGMERRADCDFPEDAERSDFNTNIVFGLARQQWTERS